MTEMDSRQKNAGMTEGKKCGNDKNGFPPKERGNDKNGFKTKVY
jgi:hypothetical protein